MKLANPQFGLVLVGGGAKGAYQVGALQYLAELGLQPQIIAGTSIGALNGAVLASSGGFPQSVRRLSELWKQLARADILRPHSGVESIVNLKQRGYEDAKRCLEPIIQTLITVKEQRQTHNSLLESIQLLLDDAPF